VIFTFALALLVLGAVTWWIERGRRRTLGALMVGSALLIAVVYAFLGSRFSIALFGHLIVTVDLPRLMATAITYTIGVLVGVGLAGGVFLWISGRLLKPTRLERQLATFIGIVLLVALVISMIAVRISR
jgi:hypothetical protein